MNNYIVKIISIELITNDVKRLAFKKHKDLNLNQEQHQQLPILKKG